MSKATLKDKIKTELITAFGTPADETRLDKFSQALSNAIIDEIIANCKVTVQSGELSIPGTGIVDSVSGPCSGASSTGTGTLNNVSFN